MQAIKIKIPKKNTRTEENAKSSIIKDILPEIEFYKFEELKQETVEPEYKDFQNFFEEFSREYVVKSKTAHSKKKVERPVFISYFSIKNLNKPIEIDLSKVKKLELTPEEIQNQVQSAYNKGFEDGQQVTQMAITEEFNKFEERVRSIDEVAENLIGEFSKQIRELKKIIVPLAIKISEHIIRNEVQTNPAIIEKQIEKALETIDNEKILNLRLNPIDAETLRKVKSKLLTDPKIYGIEIILDPQIEQGGCILETEVGKIDATIESQLKKIETHLKNTIIDLEENV
ncbi:MAG: FliH/SctL family protein [Candidatus Kapaibacteriota bacterium]|jgi:flagellar biosynthesis/type III secretory pathway protein FliH